MDRPILCFYGCAKKHRIDYPDILVITNDIDNKSYPSYACDIRDILSGKKIPGIILSQYDCYIFTPPCNYYSRGNYRRESSRIALETKDLLPLCIEFCVKSNKPFLVENVMNSTLLGNIYPQYQFAIGGHTFWSNLINIDDVRDLDFVKNQNKNFISPSKRDMNPNVHIVIRQFLLKCKEIIS